jgi:hypothetical protein
MPDQLPAGFTKMPNGVLLNAELSTQARLLYALLQYHARDSSECWPSMERLAGYMGFSRRTTSEYMNELVAAELVEKVRSGPHRNNVYRLMGSTLPISGQLSGSQLPTTDVMMGSTVPMLMGSQLPKKKMHKKETEEDLLLSGGQFLTPQRTEQAGRSAREEEAEEEHGGHRNLTTLSSTGSSLTPSIETPESCAASTWKFVHTNIPCGICGTDASWTTRDRRYLCKDCFASQTQESAGLTQDVSTTAPTDDQQQARELEVVELQPEPNAADARDTVSGERRDCIICEATYDYDPRDNNAGAMSCPTCVARRTPAATAA